MRDAFGGVFMLTLMLVFIVILTAFGAISFKYAKSFRAKNAVIDFIEQNQVIDLEHFFSTGDEDNNNEVTLRSILARYDYNNTCMDGFGLESGYITSEEGNIIGYCQNGVLIYGSKVNDHTINYDIYTYVNWDLESLNMLLRFGGYNKPEPEAINGAWIISGKAVVKY